MPYFLKIDKQVKGEGNILTRKKLNSSPKLAKSNQEEKWITYHFDERVEHANIFIVSFFFFINYKLRGKIRL